MKDFALIEEVDAGVVASGITIWQDSRWRATSRGLLWWLADSVVADTRDAIKFDQMLRDKERDGLLTREQASTVQG